MNKTVIFDLDDTLGNLKERLVNIYKRELGMENVNSDDWTFYGAGTDRYNITSDRLTELFIEDQSLELMKPHDGVVEVTAILKSRGYNIEIVTARGWRPDAYNVTKKWLDDNYISYDKINIVPLHQCKEEATRHIENIHLFVDDRFDHCDNMMKSGRVNRCLVYKQPWNKAATLTQNIVHIDNVYDVLEHT